MNTANLNKERRLRRALEKAGYQLHKSRVKTINADNLGGYMIVYGYYNCVAAGSRYELDLDDVEAFVQRCAE